MVIVVKLIGLKMSIRPPRKETMGSEVAGLDPKRRLRWICCLTTSHRAKRCGRHWQTWLSDLVFALEYAVTVEGADQVSCMDQAKGQICHDDDESTGWAQLSV